MLLVLYSHPVKRVVTFLLLWNFAFLFTYIAARSTQRLTQQDATCHIDYSGLEGTKGDASAIRRYFAYEEVGCDVLEEEEEGDEEAVGIYFGSFF